ncbi:hypothetical protein WHR41_04021 [Cladosporium halotolerans]|uniref:Major facilitator superfamily (MFS) profile domain-containing protein n=1 Tax=Cladosporium halotolerans TaxID=1052096 RepID=A0AB34KU25_9PEZI
MGFSPFRKEADEARDEHSPIPPDYEHAAASGSTGGAAPEELEGLSLFEKKCVLINNEIDRNGFGRYQWYIWGLCGLGYFIDLIWAQAFGLILSPLQQELGFPGDQSGNISVAFSSGLTAGAFVWGFLVDIIGRQWAFNLTCFISAAFGLGLGGCSTYTAFLVVTAFNGFGIGGNIPIDTTICLEFIPQNKRFMLALLSIFQPIGVTICCAIAYGFIPRYSCDPDFTVTNPDGSFALQSCNITPPGEPCCSRSDNMGWRYLMFTLGAITLFIFFLRFVIFNFKESPKFLVYRGQDQKAIEVLQHVAKVNKRECGITLQDFEALTAEDDSTKSATHLIGSGNKQRDLPFMAKVKIEFVRYGMLFKGWQITRLTLLVWLIYICDFWGFTLAGTYLPAIFAAKNGALGLSIESTYKNYLSIYTPGIVAVVLGSMMYRVPVLGRQMTMLISAALMAVSIFVFSAVNTQPANIGLNMMEYFFQSMFNAVLYGWTPEVFPAPVRGTGSGLASFWGRLFGIIAPLTAQTLLPAGGIASDPRGAQRVLYLAGGVTLGAVLGIALLPRRMVGRQSF